MIFNNLMFVKSPAKREQTTEQFWGSELIQNINCHCIVYHVSHLLDIMYTTDYYKTVVLKLFLFHCPPIYFFYTDIVSIGTDIVSIQILFVVIENKLILILVLQCPLHQ